MCSTWREWRRLAPGGVEVGTGLGVAIGRVGNYAQNLPSHIGQQVRPNLDHVCEVKVEKAGSVDNCAGLCARFFG